MTTPPHELLPDTRRAYERLRDILAGYGSVMTAYSGGVDSALLAWVADDVLGNGALAVIGISASLAEREHDAAITFLTEQGMRHESLATNEMDDANYRRNHADRCYFCKSELFTKLRDLALERGFDRIAYGANLDDRGDYRPGASAAADLEIVAPLQEAGFSKAMVRETARALGLPLWDKPAAPCLASRVPYFSEVTPEKLRQIEQAEAVLKDNGFPVCRVRHYDDVARVEVPLADIPRLAKHDTWLAVVVAIRGAGFHRVLIDREGLRSGRLNDVIGKGRPA